MKSGENRSVKVFRFICSYTREHGFPPTLHEIAQSEGFRSNSGVIRHLDKLEQWGWIERYHGNARSIRILRRCESAKPNEGRETPFRQLVLRR